MNITADDYDVISAYAGNDRSWMQEVSTTEKINRLIAFSWEVAAVFIAVGAHTGNWQRYYEGRS